MSDAAALPHVAAARRTAPTAVRLVGLAAPVFSALYLVSDVLEAIQGGFSTGQLGLTLVAEAAIPGFVIGLYATQRPHVGRVGRVSAVAYSYSYVFFTGTVVDALIDHTSDYATLSHDLGLSMTVHGAIMVLVGLGFGSAVIRADFSRCCHSGVRFPGSGPLGRPGSQTIELERPPRNPRPPGVVSKGRLVLRPTISAEARSTPTERTTATR